MSLEFFSGFDSQEGVSEAALEELKERMREAAAHIAAIRKEEGKQKKSEDKLIQILFHFVKSSQNGELVGLITKCLEKNIPANFILSLILLSNKEIQQALEIQLLPKEFSEAEGAVGDLNTRAITFFREDQTMPIKVKIQLDSWIKELIFQANENPQKLLKTAFKVEIVEYDGEKEHIKKIANPLVGLFVFVMDEFLRQNKMEENEKKLHDFASFILHGIFNKAKENLDNRLNLEGESIR